MGNSSQCGFLSNNDQQYQFLGQVDHFLYGQIKHFKKQEAQNQHFAIKKIEFASQNTRKQYSEFIQLYQSICSPLRLIKANEYIDQHTKQKKQKEEGENIQDQKQNSNPVFYCNKNNFIFTSASEELSCAEPSFSMNIYLQYIQQKSTLESIISEKSSALSKTVQNSKINQNILLELENKVKLCEYDKIDRLPHKERSIINLFFNEIEVLRMLDYMLTSLYGLKLNGIQADCVRPELFFRSEKNDQIAYFCPQLLMVKGSSNIDKSYELLKKWLIQENANFHHNWSMKQRDFVSYVHPSHLQRLTQELLSQGQNNFSFCNAFSRQQIEKQNIFALGLIILEICLLEPHICSKVYNISVCRKEQMSGPKTKVQMKYSFHKENLTIKFNSSALQKYLIRMKTRYSEEFVELIETMIFGPDLRMTQYKNTTLIEKGFTYHDVIESLQSLIQRNVQSIKSVYNSTNKSKSKSKNCTEKNSRKPSLTRQVSSSGVSNQSLSSSSSLSMLPVQSNQRVLSMELLKKHCQRVQNNIDRVFIKSELQTLQGSFAKRQNKLEELISQDEVRILSQLNKLSNEKSIVEKQGRFGYRRTQLKQPQFNPKRREQTFLNFPTSINLVVPHEQQVNFKLNVPSSLLSKQQAQSQDKEKRMNSTTKIKKIILQRARQEESLGNSVCQTIFMNRSSEIAQGNESGFSVINSNESANRKIETNMSKNELKNTQITDKEISAFEQDLVHQFSSKSELKNLIGIKNKSSTNVRQHSNIHLNADEKSLKQLKSKQLYEIYMNEYKNLINCQNITKNL